MKNCLILENRIIHQRELTAFVREVVLPGSSDKEPILDSSFCFFDLEYQRSPIHRWGIFAAEKIPAKHRMIEYTGQKIDVHEVWRRRIRQHLYIFRLNENEAIDGAIGGSGAEFINHSCQPNLEASLTNGRIFYVSKRRIMAGEELTVDYKISNDTDLPCSCGAAKCAGIINRRS